MIFLFKQKTAYEMRIKDGSSDVCSSDLNDILYSPTDLVRFLGCNHATALDLLRLRNPESAPVPAKDDEMAKLVQQAGLAHEDRYRAKLLEDGGLIEIPIAGSLEHRAKLTREAMEQDRKSTRLNSSH